MEIHSLYLIGRNAVCPVCSGLVMTTGEGRFRCNDCTTRYKVCDNGLVDKEIYVEMIGGSRIERD